MTVSRECECSTQQQIDITKFMRSRLNAKVGWSEQDEEKKEKALKDVSTVV